jgi:hypothetical protein
MTVASDVAAPSGLTGSIGTTVGVALVSAGLQAASLTMTSGPAAAPGTPSEHLVKEAQRTLEDARALVAAVYRNSGLIDAMKASAQRLGVDHDERRHDGRSESAVVWTIIQPSSSRPGRRP